MSLPVSDLNKKADGLTAMELGKVLPLTAEVKDDHLFIGGSDGVTKEVKQRATERISFGPITLPHNLARVVLLEQIYRAFKIIRHEPYHK